MNSEIYQELFHYVSFPVFAVSQKGMMLYKNPACAKYLPAIYGSRSIKSKIVPEFPQESGPVHVLGGSAYSAALALTDGDRIVFLCFSRLQCADGMQVAEKLLEIWGRELSDFLVGFKRTAVSRKYHDFETRFVDADILSVVKDEIGLGLHEEYPLPALFAPVFERLNVSFETIGYSFFAEIEKDFPGYLPVKLSVNDLLFLFGRLLYLVMKFSVTRKIRIVLFTEVAYSRHTLRLETKTNREMLPQVSNDGVLLLKSLIPECAAEIDLLDRIGLMQNMDFSIRADALGTLAITYHFPYTEPNWGCVCSAENFALLPILGNIENMINGILKRLTDKDASC